MLRKRNSFSGLGTLLVVIIIRFGCPPLPGAQTLAVTCLPRVSLSAFDAKNVIQPGAIRYVSEGLELPVADSQWFRWALEPAPDEQIDAMVDA